MVQQPSFNGGPSATVATTLAVPAIVAGQQQQQQQQPSQYSPQTNYYPQQQLVKQQQPQFLQQQAPRVNGLTNMYPASQQDSPSSQQRLEVLYSGPQQRPAPVYAPKPTFYGQTTALYQQQQQQQQQQQPQQRPMQQAALYGPQAGTVAVQQQHSPALRNGQQTGLSVRQLPTLQTNGLGGPQQVGAAGLSPVQQIQNQQQAVDQRQQQMQQLIMSYQQQQQHLNTMQQSDFMQQTQQYVQHVQEPINQQHVDVRWSHIDDNHLHSQHNISNHHQQQNTQQQPNRLTSRSHARSARLSDRDSVSTLSRFNQFDDRRSFTMRSQYTSAQNSNRYSSKFGFVKLTSEALKRIFGLTGSKSAASLDKRNLQQNLNLSVTGTHGNNKNVPNIFDASQHGINTAASKITVIDSGEDQYFKKRVFRYQLNILRLISFLCAAFVLLSPVTMLLIPKMEFMFHNHESYSDSASPLASSPPSSAHPGESSQSAQSAPSITHSVGLTGANKQAQNQQSNYFVPQPQWRISECTSDCDGLLVGFVARLIMLCMAYWAIFFRSQTATLPRIDFHRCLLISIAILLTLSYWLFFIFRVFDKRYNDFELQYITIVQFALSMLESLILLHYIAVVLLELRQREKRYCLKVVRSPDGTSQYYSCGALSIQKCAQYVLEKYHREFKNYDALTEQTLELENQLAQSLAGSRDERSGDKSPRNRPSSPANSHRGDTLGGRSTRRSASRASRHQSRSGAHNRSPSGSPVRSSRSRSQRKYPDADRSNSRSDQVKLYQVDPAPPKRSKDDEQQSSSNGHPSDRHNNNNSTARSSQDSSMLSETSKKHENDSNSADQSSDATSRVKESSLETIRAANSTSDLLDQAKTTQAGGSRSSVARNRNSDEHAQPNQQSSRDETESVRSVRSRRSTARSHHRHREHRERSSSRANDNGEPQISRRHGDSVIVPMSTALDAIDDHERKLRRRKLRLLAAVQNAFEQIKRTDEDHQPLAAGSSSSLGPQQAKQPLGPSQAARSLYPSMARSLQKYLRLTRQTSCHNLQSIYEHLAKCLSYGLSARAFIEKFVNQDPVWQQSETNLFANCKMADSVHMYPQQRTDGLEINSWSLICDTLLSRQIGSGTFFILKQGQVSLLVTVAKLPHLSLSEEVINQKSCKFIIAPNSETSV